MAAMPDFFAGVQERLLRELAAAVNEWGSGVTALAHWEDSCLLDHPTPDLLAQHRATVEGLIRFGEFVSLTTAQPGFPDQALARSVAATLRTLRDKIPLWHGRMPTEEAEAVLRAVFHEPGT
jgi:hypothetical protein